MAIQDELKLFVENFKLENGRIPTQNEIVKGTGKASTTIKKYLIEGTDFAKPLTKLEAAKLGGQASGHKKCLQRDCVPSKFRRLPEAMVDNFIANSACS